MSLEVCGGGRGSSWFIFYTPGEVPDKVPEVTQEVLLILEEVPGESSCSGP